LIGAVLAGGAGRRLGRGSKAAVQVRGRALVSWPLEALAAVCERVAVVCKHGTGLPELTGVERWNEPDHPQHPLIGITHALERAGEPVLVCAADMPWVTADSCRSLVNAAGAGDGAPAVAVAGGVLQPVFTRRWRWTPCAASGRTLPSPPRSNCSTPFAWRCRPRSFAALTPLRIWAS